MGCILSLFTKKPKDIEEVEAPKLYSWDLRREKNVDDFKLENLVGVEKFKGPPSLGGEQFIIKNCTNCKICLLDHMSMLTIDDSSNCLFILGPVKGSIFLRNCSNCVCIVACSQFRMRDCKRINLFLHSATTPSIESSSDIEFSCYQLNYAGLKEQFKLANLNIFNNSWYSVHDFTPSESSWRFLPTFCTLESLVNLENTSFMFRRNLNDLQLDLSKRNSVVPQAIGLKTSLDRTHEFSLVTFFINPKIPEQQETTALTFITELTSNYKDISLVATRQANFTLKQINEIFENKSLISNSEYFPIIALYFCGPDCINSCNKVAFELMITPNSILISGSKTEAEKQAELFFSISDMLS